MDTYTATEQAYQNGFEAGKKAAIVEATWKIINRCEGQCSRCGAISKSNPFRHLEKFCYNCGARMK